MQRAIITISFIIFALSSLAQNKGDTLYVAAHSGLNLRTEPGTKATKLAAIPKGGQVIVLADLDSSLAHSVTEFPGFEIKGFWVEVDYNGQVGYVFSGYLSGFKPNLMMAGDTDTSIAPDYEYLMRHFKPLVEMNNVQYHESVDNYVCGWQRTFEKGIHYEGWFSCEEAKGFTVTLTFSIHSIQEVYLFMNQVYKVNEDKNNIIYWDKESKQIESHPMEGAGCHYTILKKGKETILKFFCGC